MYGNDELKNLLIVICIDVTLFNLIAPVEFDAKDEEDDVGSM